MDRLQKRIALVISIFSLMLVIVLSWIAPRSTFADFNEPTATPITPTVVQEATLTPEPTEEEISPDESIPMPTAQPTEQSQDNAPTSVIRSLSTVNLCLLVIAVILLIGVMVMVIYGVIQRMSE